MISKRIKFILYFVLCAVQLSVPVLQILKFEDVLRSGSAYKLRTAPVDPYDAFRGRYVALNYKDTKAKIKTGEKIEYEAPAYVTLQMDKDGFAQYVELTKVQPLYGDFLRVADCYMGYGEENALAHFNLPFDRFYMEESKAPRAETAYREHVKRRDDVETSAYVVLRVKDGRGVIEDLYIDNMPIREYLKKSAEILQK